MLSFEIQTYADGRWKMDSVFDDRTLAIHEAKKMDENSRYFGVRVIEENYDEATDKTTSRTLFRGGAAKGEKAKRPVSNGKAARGATQRGTGREPGRNGSGKRARQKSTLLVPLLSLLVLIMAGIIVLLGLQFLPGFK